MGEKHAQTKPSDEVELSTAKMSYLVETMPSNLQEDVE